MKKIILLALLVLPSCTGVQTHALNSQYQSKFKAEMAAWEKVEREFLDTCGKNVKLTPIPKTKAVALTKCKTTLVNEVVMPVAAYPDLVMTLRANALKNADRYARGNISADAYQALGQKNYADYLGQADKRYYSAMNNAIQRDQVAAQQTQQALQNMAVINSVQNQSSYVTPMGSCRFNPLTRNNQQCLHILTDGSCAHWGTGC